MAEENSIMEQFDALDREALMKEMAGDLPLISGEMGMVPADIAFRTGLDRERLSLMVQGKRKMKWSEYLSILFLLWDDERGKEIIEKRGLFPEALKRAMSFSRNIHESDK